MGADPYPSSPCSLHRARRRSDAGWALGRMQAELLSSRPRSIALLSSSVSRTVANGVHRRRLSFHGELARLRDPAEFARYLKPLTNVPWVVFAKRPFAGPSQILDYLGRYTHRVAIANGRLLDCEDGRVSFRWKDYRAQNKSKAMTLDANEFMRRFLTHVLPKGFRRIRHFGFLANACCREKLARIRTALAVPNPEPRAKPKDYRDRCALLTGKRLDICPCCGGRMVDADSWRPPSPPRSAPRWDSS